MPLGGLSGTRNLCFSWWHLYDRPLCCCSLLLQHNLWPFTFLSALAPRHSRQPSLHGWPTSAVSGLGYPTSVRIETRVINHLGKFIKNEIQVMSPSSRKVPNRIPVTDSHRRRNVLDLGCTLWQISPVVRNVLPTSAKLGLRWLNIDILLQIAIFWTFW